MRRAPPIHIICKVGRHGSDGMGRWAAFMKKNSSGVVGAVARKKATARRNREADVLWMTRGTREESRTDGSNTVDTAVVRRPLCLTLTVVVAVFLRSASLEHIGRARSRGKGFQIGRLGQAVCG